MAILATACTDGAARGEPPAAGPEGKQEFKGSRAPLPAEILEMMKQHSWRPGCPVAPRDLVYLRVSHWDTDNRVTEGELVVHRDVAREVLGIFREIFEHRFPIEKMRLIETYEGDDDKSMADNNTSAFNCRYVKGRKGVFSKHSRGRAIDINPLLNPLVRKGLVDPPAGKPYVDRTRSVPGMIQPGDPVHRAFSKRGWTWGGTWRHARDYQHFEKRSKRGATGRDHPDQVDIPAGQR